MGSLSADTLLLLSPLIGLALGVVLSVVFVLVQSFLECRELREEEEAKRYGQEYWDAMGPQPKKIAEKELAI